MNIALIIAGGQGNRMGQDIPKQFMYVEDKPIIIHTLQAFEKHPDIDIIAVVCQDYQITPYLYGRKQRARINTERSIWINGKI